MTWQIPEAESGADWDYPETEFGVPGFGAGGFGAGYYGGMWVEPEDETTCVWVEPIV